MAAPVLRVPGSSQNSLPQAGGPPGVGGGPPAASLDDALGDQFGGPAGLDDPGRHNELDLGAADGGPSLELDLGDIGDSGGGASPFGPPAATPPASSFGPPASPPAAAPPPSAFAPPTAKPRPSGASPFAPPPAAPKPPPAAPKPPAAKPQPPAAPSFGLSAGTGDDLDLPAPADLDLPSPVGKSGLPETFGPPVDTLDLPTPSQSNLPGPRKSGPAGFAPAPELDLPAPVGPELTDLPTPAVDLPAPAQSNLVAPAGSNLVTPVGQELRPSGQDLRPSGQDLRPTGQDLRPTSQEMQPSVLDVRPAGGSELAPGDLPLPKRGSELRPVGADDQGVMGGLAPVAPGGVQPAPGGLPQRAGVSASPAPLGDDKPAVSKGLLIGMGALLVIGLAGAGVMYSGILDPQDPGVGGQRGGGKAGDDGTAQVDTDNLTGPSDAVLAELAKDTPASYKAAFSAAEAKGNPAAQAEALVLLTYRYGPDTEAGKQAAPLVQAIASSKEPFAQRVVGLVALAGGDLAGADKVLVGDDTRTRLYRGWLRLAQDKPDEALAEAEAVLAANGDDVAGLHLQLAAKAANNPAGTLAEVTKAASDHGNHPRLTMLAVRTALAAGRLKEARELSSKLEPGEAAQGFRARLLALQAELAAAAGDYSGAVQRFDQAHEYLPDDVQIAMARIRALVAANQTGKAATDAIALAAEHPNDVEVQLLEAEVQIEAGEGDRALAAIGKVREALAEDPRIPHLEAEVHAMRAEVDEGRPLYAAARKLDPKFYDASIGEGRMLADARQLGEALGVFDTARKTAADAGDHKAAARILVAKANALRKDGQSRAAMEALSQAIGEDPTHNPAQVQRGAMLLADGKRKKAREDLWAVYERTGGYPGLAEPLGRVLLAEGNYEALEQLVGDRLRGEDTDDEVLLLGAQLRLAQGELEEARDLTQFALNRDPNNWKGHAQMARVKLAEGKYEEALSEIESARPADPEPELMLTYGEVLEYNQQAARAAPQYLKALKEDPNLHKARYLYGRLLVYDGAHEQGLAELQVVADHEDAQDQGWYPDVWMSIGRAREGLVQYDKAADAFAKAHKLSPDLGEAYAEEGKALYNLNEHARAIKALDKAVELGRTEDAWYADALMNLGRAQNKAGQTGAAKKTFKKFLEVAPETHTGRPEAQRVAG